MFNLYLSRDNFNEFNKNIILRTKGYFKYLIENMNLQISNKDYDYFYNFCLPLLIEIDYLSFTISKSNYSLTNQHSNELFTYKTKYFLKIYNK